jgi:flagellar hook-length control protein FliK
MNSGSILSTLMGATSTNPASAKTAAAKTRAETNEKFQQAFNQVRPEVAAPKPAARKTSPVAERLDAHRADVKSASPHPSRNETNRTPAQQKPAVADRDASDTVAVQDPKTADPASKNATQSAAPGAGEQLGAQTPTAVIDENLLVDSGVNTVDLIASAEVGLGEETLLLPSELENLNPAELETDEIQDPGLLAGLLTVPSELPQDDNSGLSPLLASFQSGATQPVATLSTVAQSIAGQASVAFTGKSDGLAVDASATDVAAEEDGLAVDIDAGENPDLLLLNSKTALNKLAEANMAASGADKTAPAAEVTKPAAVNAAVESLTRLSDSQSPAARAFVVQTGVPVTVGTPQWSQAVGDRVLWLAAQNVSSAEIRLDPPELGPLQVKVSVNQDQANITFISPHAAVRDALDQQLHRLREMFSEQGLNLGNVDVSDKSFAQQEREQGEAHANRGNLDADEEAQAPVAVSPLSMRLVDHYA